MSIVYKQNSECRGHAAEIILTMQISSVPVSSLLYFLLSLKPVRSQLGHIELTGQLAL